MNLLSDYGYNQEKIDQKVESCWKTIFEGKKTERLYFDAADDTGYILDPAEDMVLAEGMGYGMMMAVQMDKKEIFDKLWKWVATKMLLDEGDCKGHFCSTCTTTGKKKIKNPSPVGEEYFAMSLFFAAHRWGNGKGIFNYEKEANSILRISVHGKNTLWNKDNHLIRFICGSTFSNPSYHLPHFYDLFSMWADAKEEDFWGKAAGASRAYIVNTCNKKTGLAPEYAQNDGTPLPLEDHGTFASSSYSVAANIGLNAMWFGDIPDLAQTAAHLITFFDKKKTIEFMEYKLDGTPLKRKAQHQVALCAAIAESVLALERSKEPVSDNEKAAAKRAVKRFWETEPVTGKNRYFDNCMYFFALLALSGAYNVY